MKRQRPRQWYVEISTGRLYDVFVPPAKELRVNCYPEEYMGPYNSRLAAYLAHKFTRITLILTALCWMTRK
jgi:hypothetical protein